MKFLLCTAALALAGSASVAAQTPGITFAKDVAPIIYSRCASCHHDGGAGPFDLTTYDAAKQRARQIATVTASRYMPPWKPEPGQDRFIGEQRLDASDIDRLRQWADAGAPAGDLNALPPAPRFNGGWQLGSPDLIVPMPAYTLPPDGTDVFRIFVVPLPVNATRYVRGLEFRTGWPNVVHHANIRVDRTGASRAFDAADPAPGYDGLIARSAGYPDGHFLAWTPGQVAPLLPKGLAWTLSPGTDLVVELHMQPTGKPELVQPTIGLFFGSDPPERTPAMLRLGRQSIDIAPGDTRYMVTDTFVLPVDVDVLALQPHAHYRAREIRGTATRPDGSVETLIEIKDWDFRWQQVYRYVDPVHLPKGTRLAMEYRYDNSADNPRNVQQPPQRVRWGQRSNDEMGDFWIQVLTRDDRDLDRLAAAFRPKQLAEDIVGYEARIAIEPSSVELHDDIAMLYLETNRTGEAVSHFAESARLRPSSAATHFNLATALTLAGRRTEAADEYRKALALRPTYALAHNNLGVLMLQQGQPDAALAHFAEAVRSEPDYAEALDNLGRVRLQRGEWRQGVDALERAVQLRPDWPAALTDLALGLSTASDAAVLNATRGVVMAERAATVTRRADPLVLDVLASAYAAAGDRTRAIATLDEALRLTSDARMAATLRAHRESLARNGR